MIDGHALVYDFKAKKWGQLKAIFFYFRVLLLGSQKYLHENENIFKNILGCESRDNTYTINSYKKTRRQTSHANVPLNGLSVNLQLSKGSSKYCLDASFGPKIFAR